MFPDAETTQYQVAVPTEDWTAWKDSIPRTMPLYERLHTLIQIDTALDGEADVSSLTLLQMKCERIAERSRTARNALENDDEGKVRAELEQIEDIAEGLAGD
jgi:hypothetical protein